jgi:hypothetical protein
MALPPHLSRQYASITDRNLPSCESGGFEKLLTDHLNGNHVVLNGATYNLAKEEDYNLLIDAYRSNFDYTDNDIRSLKRIINSPSETCYKPTEVYQNTENKKTYVAKEFYFEEWNEDEGLTKEEYKADLKRLFLQEQRDKFLTKLSNKALIVDVSTRSDYKHFESIFTEFHNESEKNYCLVKEPKTLYYDFNGEKKEYKLFKFKKGEKVLYGIKARGIEDDIDNADQLLAFSKHLQHNYFSSNKYTDKAFNCYQGISRSLTLAIIAALWDKKGNSQSQDNDFDFIKSIVKKRYDEEIEGGIESYGNTTKVENEKLFLSYTINPKSIIKAFAVFDDTLSSELKDNLRNHLHINFKKYINFKKNVSKIIESKNLLNKFNDDYTEYLSNNADKNYDQRKVALADLTTACGSCIEVDFIHKKNENSWIDGFKNSLQNLTLDQLNNTLEQLNTDITLNNIFESSRLSALHEAGKTTQLQELKEKAKNAVMKKQKTQRITYI